MGAMNSKGDGQELEREETGVADASKSLQVQARVAMHTAQYNA